MQENAVCGSLSRQESAKNFPAIANSLTDFGEDNPKSIAENPPLESAGGDQAFSELAQIVSSWPRLPEYVRQAILLLISGCESAGGSHAVACDENPKEEKE